MTLKCISHITIYQLKIPEIFNILCLPFSYVLFRCKFQIAKNSKKITNIYTVNKEIDLVIPNLIKIYIS